MEIEISSDEDDFACGYPKLSSDADTSFSDDDSYFSRFVPRQISTSSRHKPNQLCRNVNFLLKQRELGFQFPTARFAGIQRSARISQLVPMHSILVNDGHVFLGFSPCGSYLMSYTVTINFEPHQSFLTSLYKYTLHFWRQAPSVKLKLVHSEPIFRDFEVDKELLLTVHQWPRESQFFIVHACVSSILDSTDSEDSIAAYLAVLSIESPQLLRVQTSYFLVKPYPKFMPHVALPTRGLVVLNTGDSVIVLTFSDLLPKSDQVNLKSGAKSTGLLPVWEKSMASETQNLRYSISNVATSKRTCTVFQGLDLFVVRDGKALQLNVKNEPGNGFFADQHLLLIEELLQDWCAHECNAMEMRFNALSDYDMQILEVNGDDCEIFGVLGVLMQIYNTDLMKMSLAEVMCTFCWNFSTRELRVLARSKVKIFHAQSAAVSRQISGKWSPCSKFCEKLFERFSLVDNRQANQLSNIAALKGESLRVLSDPMNGFVITL